MRSEAKKSDSCGGEGSCHHSGSGIFLNVFDLILGSITVLPDENAVIEGLNPPVVASSVIRVS